MKVVRKAKKWLLRFLTKLLGKGCYHPSNLRGSRENEFRLIARVRISFIGPRELASSAISAEVKIHYPISFSIALLCLSCTQTGYYYLKAWSDLKRLELKFEGYLSLDCAFLWQNG